MTSYVGHVRSDDHSQLGFHCIPCILSYLGDDALMLPQHLAFVSELNKMLKPMLMEVIKMHLDTFYLVLKPKFVL